MRSALAVMPDLKGSQSPRVELVPEGVEHPNLKAAEELVEAAEIFLDPWQKRVFRGILLQRSPTDPRYAAFRAAVNCPRQNGKNEIILALQLAGLFVLEDRLVVHSAHLTDTSLEAFQRLRDVIESHDWLRKEVRSIRSTNGQEHIKLKSGCRVRFRTRTKGGGRGLTGDRVFFDEAMDIKESAHSALIPILSARPNPQIIYTGSAVNQEIHDHGVVFARVREDGFAGDDPALAYWEWSAPFETPEEVDDPANPEYAAMANPSLGIRISLDYVGKELRAFGGDTRGFAVERLGVGDWPRTDLTDSIVDFQVWAELEDKAGTRFSAPTFTFDVAPDRSRASISVAGLRDDGLYQVELVERAPGTGWVKARLEELCAKHKADLVLCDGAGPAASLIHELEVEVQTLDTPEYAEACGMFVDLVERRELRHHDSPELTSALKGAAKRPLGDRFAWSRRNSSADITPLVSGTIALYGAATRARGGIAF